MRTVAWDDYANTYDLMAERNPAYQDLLRRFAEFAANWQLTPGARVLEIGAGTGNFSLLAASLHSDAHILHSEPEPAMQRHAQVKAQARRLSNLRFLPRRAEDMEFTDGELSGAILVHVLYTLPDPIGLLRRLHGWLRRGAPDFACDLGRLMDVADWRRYLIIEISRTLGWRQTLLTLWRGRGIARANRDIATLQRSGRYWTHSSEEFAATLREAGFTIKHQETAYRGYSDIVLCLRD